MTVTGYSSLCFTGLVADKPRAIDVATCNDELNGCEGKTKRYHYREYAKDRRYLNRRDDMEIPTEERALVEYMLYPDEMDEGALIWALQTYIELKHKDLNLLYKVADYFHLPRETVDYWIKEAEEEDDMSMG